MTTETFHREEVSAFGLCANCEHARVIQSAKGSSFLLCELSQTDARFPKYPRLPVLTCSGYSPEQKNS
jgi:hypothetical protein